MELGTHRSLAALGSSQIWKLQYSQLASMAVFRMPVLKMVELIWEAVIPPEVRSD